MKAWLAEVFDALRLRGAAFAQIAEKPDAFLRGLLVVVAAALIAGLPALVSDVAAGFRPLALEPTEAQKLSISPDLLRPWLRSLGLPEDAVEQVVETSQSSSLLAATLATEVQQLSTPLPRPVAQAFRAAGAWLSQPFTNSQFPLVAASLATWLGYGIWVMLAAKLLGGRGTLHGFFGATGFFAAPHVLNILSPAPVLGPLVAIIAFLWGLTIYVIATAVSHRLSGARALAAVFAPLAALAAAGALLMLVLAFLALVIGFGGSSTV